MHSLLTTINKNITFDPEQVKFRLKLLFNVYDLVHVVTQCGLGRWCRHVGSWQINHGCYSSTVWVCRRAFEAWRWVQWTAALSVTWWTCEVTY